MNRIDVIQNIIDKIKANIYLEIGVRSGDAFLKIKAKNKYGVDPNFTITLWKKFRYYFKNPYNIFNKYFIIESDAFFDKEKSRLSKSGIDVVFIDGLHTFHQSLRDVQNSLKYLNKNGIIVLHDCNPSSAAAALPAKSFEDIAKSNPLGFTGVWNGDVWKTIVYLRAAREDLNVFVLDCDFGLGIITKEQPESILKYSADEVHNLTYDDLSKNRKTMLNLKEAIFLQKFLSTQTAKTRIN